MDECIFCKIGRKELAVKAVASSDYGVAFLDINPVAPGHVVVIVKRHMASLEDMRDDEVTGLFTLVRDVSARLKNALQCDSFNIGLNLGKAAGWGVPHVHVHIIPRFVGDGGGSMHTIVRNPPKETIDEIYRKIMHASATVESQPEPEPEPLPPVKETPKPEPKQEQKRKIPKEWEFDL